MLKKVFSAIVLMAVVFITSQGLQPATAEAADVWAYGNNRQGYNVYVMSETVKVTANNTIKCRTKTVRAMEYDVTGWEFAKDNNDNYYYRVCESEGKGGLRPFEGEWHDLSVAPEMIQVLQVCIDCLN